MFLTNPLKNILKPPLTQLPVIASPSSSYRILSDPD